MDSVVKRQYDLSFEKLAQYHSVYVLTFNETLNWCNERMLIAVDTEILDCIILLILAIMVPFGMTTKLHQNNIITPSLLATKDFYIA